MHKLAPATTAQQARKTRGFVSLLKSGLRRGHRLQFLAVSIAVWFTFGNLTALAASAETLNHRQIFAYATELYRKGDFSAAYGRFRWLANGGDKAAARIALFMVANGETLYGSGWSSTPSEYAQWLLLVQSPEADTYFVRGD